MPPLRMGAYLIDVLWDAGPLLHNGMGSGPLPHSELLAWQENAGVRLHPWELSAVRRLSMEYYAELMEARQPDRPAPFADSADVSLLGRLQVERSLDTFLD